MVRETTDARCTLPSVAADPVTVTDFLPALVTGVTAIVAGVIALLIHGQRLRHEREEADLTLARDLLAEGARLVDRVTAAVKRDLAATGDIDYPAYRRAVGDSADGFGAYALRLGFCSMTTTLSVPAWRRFAGAPRSCSTS
jgi:hypothetical protein